MKFPQITLGPMGRDKIVIATAAYGYKLINKALELGPMSEEELSWMREFGDIVHATRAFRTDPKDWIKKIRRGIGQRE